MNKAWIEQAHPEKPTVPAPETPMADSELRGRLIDFRQAHELSNSSLCKKLGYSSSVISQYLAEDGNKYTGDVSALERRVRDFLGNEARRRASGVTTIECPITKQIRTALETIRRTNDVGAILGESGEGKTRGIEHYLTQNPTAVAIHVRSWARDLRAVETLLFESVGRTGWDKQTRYSLHIVRRLTGSDRLILVDDAHKLTRQALQYLFDLHDETGCPIGLFGTYSLEDTLKDDAQRFGRVGYYHEIKPEKPQLLIEHLIEELCRGIERADAVRLADLASQVAEQHGHFRAVHKQLKLTAEIHEASGSVPWPKCFEAAHKKLIREYALT